MARNFSAVSGKKPLQLEIAASVVVFFPFFFPEKWSEHFLADFGSAILPSNRRRMCSTLTLTEKIAVFAPYMEETKQKLEIQQDLVT